MPVAHILRESPIVRSPRVVQLEGLFEVTPSQKSYREWDVDLPLESRPWHIGLIVGPSGSGKTTIAKELFGDVLVRGFCWPEERSIVDGFPGDLGIKEITHLLSSVGFSSPPSWLRPFACLSNGEQFRVTVARALAENAGLVVLDEFTSVIDRTVAQIGCAAVSKVIRQRGQQFIGVSCHYDIEEWLQPDWVYDAGLNAFHWRSLQRRPSISLEFFPCTREAWGMFRHYHYLNGNLNNAAKCFLACVNGAPAVFIAILSFPHPRIPAWKGHRVVCLPDYQGVGIGIAVIDYTASLFAATGKPFVYTASNPSMIRHHAKSPAWTMTRQASLQQGKHNQSWKKKMAELSANNRITASFRYVGPCRREEAAAFGLLAT